RNNMVDVVFDTVSGHNTTLPTIASMTPADGSPSADPNVTILLNFSKQIDANTLDGTNIQVLDGSTPITTTISYPPFGGNPVVSVVPAPVLALSHNYSVSISGVKDLGGNAIATVTKSFMTAAAMPTYSCPCNLFTPPPPGVGGIESGDDVTAR